MDNRNNGMKVLSILALVFAVVGMAVGFAAFSNTLIISSSAYVQPDASKFDVNFSNVGTAEVAGDVVASPAVAFDTTTPTKVVTPGGSKATIDNTDVPTISNLRAYFTEPGQSVTYTFYAHNAGEYIAYLNSITFANVENSSPAATKVCTAQGDTTQDLVDTACEDISIKVKVGTAEFDGSEPSISDHSLALDAYETVEVTIAYATNDDHINIADGDFEVEFGDISLVYGSAD